MKTNSTIARLIALSLVGGIAVATASADAATATRNPITAKAATAPRAATREYLVTVEQPIATTTHAWLGADAENWSAPAGRTHHSAPGVKLTKVEHGTPAYRSGLRSGDVIWKYDGARLTSTAQLISDLRQEKAGSTVPVEIFRHGQREDLKVKLGTARTTLLLPRSTYVFLVG